MNLYEICKEKTYIIIDDNLKYNKKRRLQDMGVVCGASIRFIQSSPFNDPKAYLINGSIIALRNEDVKKIIVKEV